MRYAEFFLLEGYSRMVWFSFALVKIWVPFSLYFCCSCFRVPAALSLLVMLISLPSGYGGPAGLVGGVDDP